MGIKGVDEALRVAKADGHEKLVLHDYNVAMAALAVIEAANNDAIYLCNSWDRSDQILYAQEALKDALALWAKAVLKEKKS